LETPPLSPSCRLRESPASGVRCVRCSLMTMFLDLYCPSFIIVLVTRFPRRQLLAGAAPTFLPSPLLVHVFFHFSFHLLLAPYSAVFSLFISNCSPVFFLIGHLVSCSHCRGRTSPCLFAEQFFLITPERFMQTVIQPPALLHFRLECNDSPPLSSPECPRPQPPTARDCECLRTLLIAAF